MASRRGKVTFVAVLLFVAACTNGQSQSSQPTAPPDAFASTPTIGGVPTTTLAPTTTVDIERVALQRVDPVSLEPMTSFEPIPMGDWTWGSTVSDDGRYLAATVSHDTGSVTELRLVDLESWAPVTSWPGSGDLIIDVDELGSVLYVTYQTAPEVRIASSEEAEATTMAALPANYSVWGGANTERGAVLWGTEYADDSERAFVATVDPVITEIPLTEVKVGTVDPVSQGPWAQYLYTAPSFTWDPVGSRLLIVHGDEDVVSEVDPLAGTVVEHPMAGTTDVLEYGARRWSAVSSDGRSLYIATRAVELIEDDDDWSVVTTPAGIEAIDTTTWEVASTTAEPISDIWVSPDGSLIGSGYSTEESESVYVSESNGLFILDGSDLSVVTHFPAETPDQYWGPITFTGSGSIAYATTWTNSPSVQAIEMATGNILSTAESTETLEMIGPAGVLASNR